MSRCKCGARIVESELIDFSDEVSGEQFITYRCGVCGSELKFEEDANV